MHGTFVWNELASMDVEKAKAFYAKTLGWTFVKFELPSGSPGFIGLLNQEIN